MADLLSPITFGAISAPHRVFMAPLTRCRAGEGNVPGPLNAEYYAQRAGAGLIISEATQVAPEGQGYPATPGIHSQAQVAGWKQVTSAVHARGGRMFAQLWHVGRSSHNVYQPGGKAPVSSSAVAIRGDTHLPDGTKTPYPVPRALETDEIPHVIEQYRKGAENARAAGFDGVEFHGANGYLPDQFLRDGVNRRTDQWGGSIENRARFHIEATKALIDVYGPDRVGIRLSPSGVFNDMSDSNARATFGYLVTQLGKLGLAYIHITEAEAKDIEAGRALPVYDPIPVSFFRSLFKGTLITNAGFDYAKGQRYLAEGWADAIAYGKLFIANPDLPERFKRIARGESVPLNAPDISTFYGGGPQGYTDYPALAR